MGVKVENCHKRSFWGKNMCINIILIANVFFPIFSKNVRMSSEDSPKMAFLGERIYHVTTLFEIFENFQTKSQLMVHFGFHSDFFE